VPETPEQLAVVGDQQMRQFMHDYERAQGSVGMVCTSTLSVIHLANDMGSH
jgi:hypothetical protein